MSLGTRYIDDALVFYAVTTRFDTGAATDADAVPSYRVYEGETSTPIFNGTMALLDSTNTAGFYSEAITLSAANGFEVDKSYSIYIQATVNSVIGATERSFVVRKKPLHATVEGRDLDVTATGAAGIDWANVENPTTALNLSATNIDPDQVVASVTGAVGSVGPSGITRASFAPDTGMQSIRSNTAQGGGADYILLDTGASSVDNFIGYVGAQVLLVSGTGAEQYAIGTSYVGSTRRLNVDRTWSVNPAVGTGFVLFPAAATTAEIAEAMLVLDWTTITSTVPSRCMLNALRALRNKWSIASTTLTVTEENDTTTAWTSSLTTSGAAVPIIGSDPA